MDFGGKREGNRKADPVLGPGVTQPGLLCLLPPAHRSLIREQFFFLPRAPGRRGHGGGCRNAVKVLKEIIACIKIFTPVEGLKPFPWALNSD